MGAWSDQLYGEILDNPADLIKRKGLEIIDEMILDDAIGASLEMRKSARLSTPTTIEPAGNSNEDLAIAEFVRWNLYEFCETPLTELQAHLFTANAYGFSLSEKVTTYIDEGPHKGKIGYARFIPQNPHQYGFKMDRGIRLAEDGIVQTAGYGKKKVLPTSKYIHYAYNAPWGSPYGHSDVEACYAWWITKKFFRRFWALYGERTASGFLDAAYAAGATPDQIENLKSMLKNASAACYFSHPDSIIVKLMESNGAAGDTYPKAINEFNIYMSRRLLTPDLLGFSAKPTGSYALGKTHLDVYVWVLEKMAEDMKKAIGQQVIKNLVVWNFGPQYPLPRLVFEPLSGGAKVEALASFYMATEKGIFTPETITDEIREWILKTLGAPHAERPEEQKRKVISSSPPSPAVDPKPEKLTAEEFTSAGGFGRRLTAIESKVNFSEIHDTFGLEDYTIETWRAIALEQRDQLIKVMRKQRIIEDKNAKLVAKLNIRKAGELHNLLASSFVTSYLNGLWTAGREVDAKVSMADPGMGDILLEPLPPAEAMKYFRSKGLKIASAAVKGYTEEAFNIAGVENQKVLAQCKAAIYRGIRDGNVLKTEKEIKDIFDGYVQTGEVRDGAVSEAWHVKTVVQTNIATALSAGRKAMFEDPDVASTVEAYMLSAVLDDRTTDECYRLDRMILTKDELASIGWPPYHFNCRTIVIPIIQGEVFELTGIPKGLKLQFKEHMA